MVRNGDHLFVSIGPLLLGPRAPRPLSLNVTLSDLTDSIATRMNALLEAGGVPAVPVRAGQVLAAKIIGSIIVTAKKRK